MATSVEFIEYVCGQIGNGFAVRYKKMFGEYMVYANDKPILLVCDNTVYVKPLDAVKDDLADAPTGIPYKGAKDHYILDIDNSALAKSVAQKLEKVTPLPKPKKKK